MKHVAKAKWIYCNCITYTLRNYIKTLSRYWLIAWIKLLLLIQISLFVIIIWYFVKNRKFSISYVDLIGEKRLRENTIKRVPQRGSDSSRPLFKRQSAQYFPVLNQKPLFNVKFVYFRRSVSEWKWITIWTCLSSLLRAIAKVNLGTSGI